MIAAAQGGLEAGNSRRSPGGTCHFVGSSETNAGWTAVADSKRVPNSKTASIRLAKVAAPSLGLWRKPYAA